MEHVARESIRFTGAVSDSLSTESLAGSTGECSMVNLRKRSSSVFSPQESGMAVPDSFSRFSLRMRLLGRRFSSNRPSGEDSKWELCSLRALGEGILVLRTSDRFISARERFFVNVRSDAAGASSEM